MALVLGLLLLFWPTKTLAVVAIFRGINFLITAGMRALDILLGLFVMVAGITVLAVPAWTAMWLLMTAIMLIILGIVGLVRALTLGKKITHTR